MMPYGWHDGGWGVFWMILSWGVMISIVWAMFRAFAPDRNSGEPLHDPKAALAERFAKGEIDADEYRERLRVLDGTDVPTTGR
jgi:putative membrane protein